MSQMASIEHVPNDLLVEILKSSNLNYVDRWNCLLTCKQFKQAVLTPRQWTHVTIQTSPIFYVRDEEEQKKDPKPKELSIHAASLMQFLHKNFLRDVVELDLSDGHFESECPYNQRKYNLQIGEYSPQKYVWQTIYGFPNLTKLSLRNVECRDYGYLELTKMSSFAKEKSSITHLNLIDQKLFTLTHKSLEVLLEACPRLEQLQISGNELSVESTELLAKYTPNIKELLCVKGQLSASELSMSCPELEVLIRKRSPWENEEETEAPTLRPEITFFNGYHDNIWTNKSLTLEQVQKLQKAFQNTAFGDSWGTPLAAKVLELKEDSYSRIESLFDVLKTMGMNVNEQVKSKDEVRFNPFKLQFPYDASFDKEPYSDLRYSPLYFYQTDGDSALHLAVKRAKSTDPQSEIYHQLMSLLIKKGADVNLRNKEGRTPICYALNSKSVKILVEAGADLTVIDNNGWNVLMNVIANPTRFFDDNAMMELVETDINYEAPDGMNALNVALLCGQFNVAKRIQKMMTKPEGVTQKSPRLSTLSCLCLSRIKEVDLDTQKELVGELLNAGFDALSQDDKGHNALHIACLYRRFDLAKELITHCKQAATLLSAQDNEGYTPLHYAVTLYPKSAHGWSECKQFDGITKRLREHYNCFESYDTNVALEDFINAVALVENSQGCIFDVVSKNGETPLHSLCRSFQFDKAPVVKQLLLNSANPDIQDIYGQTPLLISCFNLDVKVVKKLLKHKVNVNASDMHGVTAVLAACHGVNKEIEEVNSHTLGYYHLNAEDEKLVNKMKSDAISSFREIIALLIKHNADFTVKDKLTWRTPLHVIAGFSFDSSDLIEQLVKEQKVDINARDVQNDAPIHSAVGKLNAKHMRKLIELGADINATGRNGLSPLLYLVTLDNSIKGNGELMKGGYKIMGHSLVYYHSWIWNSVELGLPRSNVYSIADAKTEREMMDELLVAFFEHADKIDFGIKDIHETLAIHYMTDFWREEDNQSAVIINSPVVKKLLTPIQLKLPVPNLFLKYATKEHLNARRSIKLGTGSSTLCRFIRFFQIIEGPNKVPKETAIEFMKDVIAKGYDFNETEGRYLLSSFTTSSCPVWPEVLDLLFENLPKSIHTSVLPTNDRTASSVMHNIFGSKYDYRKHVKSISTVLLKHVPQLLNEYNDEGRTPLMEAQVYAVIPSNSTSDQLKIHPAVELLLSHPGLEVNKRNRDTGATALHYAAYNSIGTLIGLFYNNNSYYYNIDLDQTLLALLDAGADPLAKDNDGRTPLDMLPSMLHVAKTYKKVLLRDEKLSLIDKPLMRVDRSGQQNNALVCVYNIDKIHAYQQEEDVGRLVVEYEYQMNQGQQYVEDDGEFMFPGDD